MLVFFSKEPLDLVGINVIIYDYIVFILYIYIIYIYYIYIYSLCINSLFWTLGLVRNQYRNTYIHIYIYTCINIHLQFFSLTTIHISD